MNGGQRSQEYKTFAFSLLPLLCLVRLSLSSTNPDRIDEPYLTKCSRTSNFDQPRKDHVLSNHVFASYSVTSPFECAVHCVSDTRCKSYNYQYAGTDCQLNNATKTGLGTSLTSQAGYAYYEHNAKTKVGVCRPNPCGPGSCSENCAGGIICDCRNTFYKGLKCEELDADDLFYNSTIMSQEPQDLLATLLGFLGGNKNWTVCWRASRDGLSSSAFHTGCDSKGTTLTIIKSGSYIFGGYSVIDWGTTGGYHTDANTFVFSLRNNEGTDPFKSSPIQSNHHVYVESEHGPTFGSGQDIKFYNGQGYSNFGHTYTAPVGMSSPTTFLAGSYPTFTATEVEVFYHTNQ